MLGFGHAWIIAILVLLLVLIILGPGRLSQVGGALGKAIKDFRKEQGQDEPSDQPRDN